MNSNCNCHINCAPGVMPGPAPHNQPCGKPKNISLRTVVIPANLGDDEEGAAYAPKPGMYFNTIVSYLANGHIYIYDSNGVFTYFPTGGGACDCDALQQLINELTQQLNEQTEQLNEQIERNEKLVDQVAELSEQVENNDQDFDNILSRLEAI